MPVRQLVADESIGYPERIGAALDDILEPVGPPDNRAEIAGLIEIRGIGLVRRPYVRCVVVRLVVDLEDAGACPRLPEADEATTTVAGIDLPRLALPIGVGGAMKVAAAIEAMAAGSG